MIAYSHEKNVHDTEGPKLALSRILSAQLPDSLLDVGCGIGTWMKAALELGVADVRGLDGILVSPESLLVPPETVAQQDFRENWNLGRRFQMAICMEVLEHLEEAEAPLLIQNLCEHSDHILFSAAAPFQDGDHHLNCQWPDYWQSHFNANGFTCDDSIRWELWNEGEIEPWYRQNMFIATKNLRAGNEPRIKAVYHPQILSSLVPALVFPKQFAKKKRRNIFKRIFRK